MAKTGKHNMVRAASAAAAFAMAGQVDSLTDESSLGNEARAARTAIKGKYNMVRAAAAAASFLIAAQASPTDESTAHKTRPTPRWTPEEIERLRRLIPDQVSVAVNWYFIANHFPGRTAKQCRERWNSQHSMRTERKIGPWTTEEDRILVEYQKKFGNKWSKISAMLPGRSDNDVKVHDNLSAWPFTTFVVSLKKYRSPVFHVKNRWWSQQRSRKRTENRAASARDDKPLKKKRAPRRKPTKKCDLTPMKSPALNEVTSMNSTEFVEKELELSALPAMHDCPLSSLSDDQLLDIVAPPVINVGTCPSSMSGLDSHAAMSGSVLCDRNAASSLVALKSGITPADKDDIASQDEYAAPQVCLQSSVKCSKWSYPPPDDQENVAPQLKKWTYPPPAQYDQARAAKAIEMFSPSHKPMSKAGNTTTLFPASINLDTLPLLTRTPMPDAQINRASRQVVTMSKIKPSPIVPKNRGGEPANLFSPLPFYETPVNECEPGLFVQTATMLKSEHHVTLYPSVTLPDKRLTYPSPDPVMSIHY